MYSFKKVLKQKVLTLTTILIGVIIISFLHYFNGFPLLMSDSIGYLNRAYLVKETSHWSNTYSAFLSGIIQVFHSVQWIAIIQNLISVTVIYIFCKTYIKHFKYWVFFLIILFLGFTTLPWFSTLVMSDIFTSISILSIILILDRQLQKHYYFVIIPISFISISAHQSHLLIIPLFSISFLLVKYFYDRGFNLTNMLQGFFLISILMYTSNIFEKNILNNRVKPESIVEGKSNPDISSGYYFIVVRIAESGELRHLLQKYCVDGNRNYLCNEYDLYDASRVKNTKITKRNTNNKSYIEFAVDNKAFALFALKMPRFYLGISKLVVKRGFYALFNSTHRRYNIGNEAAAKRYRALFKKINQNDISSFNQSKQLENFYPKFIRQVYKKINNFWWFILFPLVFILILFLYFKKELNFNIHGKHILIFLIIGHIINTLVCATFSNYQNGRYATRTLWLVNLVIIFITIQLIQHFTLKNRLKKA